MTVKSYHKADEAMDSIRVTYYHKGLKSGYLAGMALSDDAKKEYVKKIRSAGNVQAPKQWSENEYTAHNQQISYVIDLATTSLNFKLSKPHKFRMAKTRVNQAIVLFDSPAFL